MKRLVFTITNDPNFDQRMIRICTSLQNAGYDVKLIGRKTGQPVTKQAFSQLVIPCVFSKGKLFYLEYNLKLFFRLLFLRFDLVCAIDLDTIMPCYLISALKRKKRVYDAHELFCEMKEVVSRPGVYRVWKWIEKTTVPKFRYGYTVNSYIKEILQKDYGVMYEVVRNIPKLLATQTARSSEDFIIYQGAVNHGRSFETLIPAFRWIDTPLHIYGKGNFFEEAKQLIAQEGLESKVILKGAVHPSDLKNITPRALMGITIFENVGLSNYYSLGNRFFDYMHAGIPQVCVAYPAYQEINNQYKVAVLIEDLSAEVLAAAINNLINDKKIQAKLRQNALVAREMLNWQNEEKALLRFYQSLW